MERDQEVRESAANVHDLSGLLAALLVCFAGMRRLARFHHKTSSIRSDSDSFKNERRFLGSRVDAMSCRLGCEPRAALCWARGAQRIAEGVPRFAAIVVPACFAALICASIRNQLAFLAKPKRACSGKVASLAARS